MTTINTALCFDSNDKAKLKLHVIELLDKKGWEVVRIAFPGVSRASAFRWKKRYMESGKRLTSLLPDSTRPKRVGSLSSLNAKVFLEEIIQEIPYKMHTIQTDNGSEFKGYFDKAIEGMKDINHVWSHPKSPKTNGYVERFNWTVQDEFINYEIDVARYDLKQFDTKLKQWVNYYNTVRPHQSLNYMTPQQYLVQLQKGQAQSLKCM